MGREAGITEEQIRDLPGYRESAAFTDLEKLVLDLAVAMTSTPIEIPDDLRAKLFEHFTKGQLAELAAAIAWENHRARLNRALGVRAMGFSEGAVCAIPEQAPSS